MGWHLRACARVQCMEVGWIDFEIPLHYYCFPAPPPWTHGRQQNHHA